jgi:hypothetical protein
MPQIVPGLALGLNVFILRGPGDPNISSTLPPTSEVNTVAVGSLWLRTDGPDSGHVLYVKTAQPNTWTAK